ncbi:DUF2520 domain-containing protein [Bradyrhizobium sp. LjRoot220]|uniref:Rossmann-like and DUF2520 domain-containing protein n=1 Tax=Bradyrhizobium sp. LjRoot220 TaxID=3342284 RepID=UPI003ED09ABD
MQEQRHGFVGCGRVGRTLAQAFANAGYQVTAAWSRKAADLALMAKEVPGLQPLASAQAVADACDFVWLTVADDAIATVADGIAWRARHRVIHCSGATEVDALRNAGNCGASIGGFHPMQMFTNPAVALKGLPGCTVGVEAEAELLESLQQMASKIGCVPVQVPPGQRALYHASAYYVGPFLIALLAEGANLWRTFGASEKQALDAMLPLLAGTLSAVRDGGLANGMGGCVARGDIGTVRKHLTALDHLDADAGQLYRALARRNVPLGLARGSLSAAAAERIGETLAMDAKADA